MANIMNMKNGIDIKNIEEAGNLIRNGELVIFPTETVYGIGANGLDAEAVKNIFIAKVEHKIILLFCMYLILKWLI